MEIVIKIRLCLTYAVSNDLSYVAFQIISFVYNTLCRKLRVIWIQSCLPPERVVYIRLIFREKADQIIQIMPFPKDAVIFIEVFFIEGNTI